MSTVMIGANLSRIMLFLAFVAGIYVVDTGKAAAQEYKRCAVENGICRLPYPTEVIYGNGNRVTSRFFNNPEVRCSNSVFGDPARGTGKSCSYVVYNDQGRNRDRHHGRDGYRPDRNPDNGRGGQWQRCAREGQYCNFSGRKAVRYGTQDRFVERVIRGGTPCDNRTFGDPDRGSAKSCFILN